MENKLFIGNTGIARDRENMLFQIAGGKEKTSDGKTGKSQRKSIYVGGLRQNQDAISQKFALAQKSAIRKLTDQFKADQKIDEEMAGRKSHIEELEKGALDAYQQIKGTEERRGELMERYQVAPDSQEQKDLELLQKANASAKDPFNSDLKLTEQEEQRLAEMPPLTEYQKEMLECDQEEEKYRDTLGQNRRDILIEDATNRATEKALLKVHPMVDAQKEAAEIMENAIKEQIGALIQEGIDKVDQDREESQKELDEAQEKALEEKIQREKLKAEEAQKEEEAQELAAMVVSAAMQETSGSQQAIENLQANIKSLIQDQVVLDVDLKGLKVNQQV